MIGGERPLLPEILDQTDCVGAKIADFLFIFASSASVVTSSEKVQLSLIGSPLCAFQWVHGEHIPKPQRVAQKCKVFKI